MTEARTFPYSAWRLTSNLVPMQVTVVGLAYPGWPDRVKLDTGRVVHAKKELYPSWHDAIARAKWRLEDMDADLARRKARLERRRSAVAKAEGCAS